MFDLISDKDKCEIYQFYYKIFDLINDGDKCNFTFPIYLFRPCFTNAHHWLDLSRIARTGTCIRDRTIINERKAPHENGSSKWKNGCFKKKASPF